MKMEYLANRRMESTRIALADRMRLSIFTMGVAKSEQNGTAMWDDSI